jgi:hypothetical protein
MKLNVNFDLLDNAVSKMGARLVEFNSKTTFKHTDIDEILGTSIGQKVVFDDITINLDGGGLFEYKGRQVLLFLPKQFNDISLVKKDYSRGNKFHVADCSTLQLQRERGTFKNYSATNNLAGKFNVYGFDSYNKRDEFDTNLNVCQNCLKKLNYKNFNTVVSRIEKNNIVNNFTTSEFFERYSTLFEYLPIINSDTHKVATNYTDNWKEVSRDYRSSKNYICETCDTSFIKYKQLLHTHHVNGEKNDNDEGNLKAVCIDCHRKEINHRHVYMTYTQLQQIYILRRDQNKVNIQTWDDVFKYSDLSMHGYIDLLKSDQNISIPDVGYVIEINNKKIALDLVWQNRYKKSAVATEYSYNFFMLKDWNILSLGDALIKYTQRQNRTIIEESTCIKETAQSAIELQSIMNYTTQIETILEGMGARARGLHGKVTKVQKKLSKDTIFKLRRIATIRNKKMHQAGFNNYIFKDFEKDCKIVLKYLNSIP